jgi:acyl carrier protein
MDSPWDPTFERLLRPLLPLLPADREIAPDLDLIGAGLDSLNVVELLSCVEDEYQITLTDEEFVQQTVATPAALWRTIALHTSARSR